MQAELIALNIEHAGFDKMDSSHYGRFYVMRYDGELYVNSEGGLFGDIRGGVRALDYWLHESELMSHSGNVYEGAAAYFYFVDASSDHGDFTTFICRSPRSDEVILSKYRVTVDRIES